MDITITIDDSILPSLTQFLMTQNHISTNPVTGASVVKPQYPRGVQELVEKHVEGLLTRLVSMYPTPEAEAILADKRAVDERMAALVRPGKKVAP